MTFQSGSYGEQFDITMLCIDSVISVSLPSTESNTTAVSLPSVSRSVMSSPYTVLATGKPSDHAFVQLQPQPAHQVRHDEILIDCVISHTNKNGSSVEGEAP